MLMGDRVGGFCGCAHLVALKPRLELDKAKGRFWLHHSLVGDLELFADSLQHRATRLTCCVRRALCSASRTQQRASLSVSSCKMEKILEGLRGVGHLGIAGMRPVSLPSLCCLQTKERVRVWIWV